MHVQTKEVLEKQINKLKAILDLFNKLCLYNPWSICLIVSFKTSWHNFSPLIFTKTLEKDKQEQWFSALSGYQDPLERLLKYSLLGPTPRFSDSVLLRCGPGICISKRFLRRCWCCCCWCGDHTLRTTDKMRRV